MGEPVRKAAYEHHAWSAVRGQPAPRFGPPMQRSSCYGARLSTAGPRLMLIVSSGTWDNLTSSSSQSLRFFFAYNILRTFGVCFFFAGCAIISPAGMPGMLEAGVGC